MAQLLGFFDEIFTSKQPFGIWDGFVTSIVCHQHYTTINDCHDVHLCDAWRCEIWTVIYVHFHINLISIAHEFIQTMMMFNQPGAFCQYLFRWIYYYAYSARSCPQWPPMLGTFINIVFEPGKSWQTDSDRFNQKSTQKLG